MKYDHKMFDDLDPVDLIDWEKVAQYPFFEVRVTLVSAVFHKSHQLLTVFKLGFEDFFVKDKEISPITWEFLRFVITLFNKEESENEVDEIEVLEFWKLPYQIFNNTDLEANDIPEHWQAMLGDDSRYFLLNDQYVILPETEEFPAMVAISWDVEVSDDGQVERSLLTVPMKFIKGNPAYMPNFLVLPDKMVVF